MPETKRLAGDLPAVCRNRSEKVKSPWMRAFHGYGYCAAMIRARLPYSTMTFWPTVNAGDGP